MVLDNGEYWKPERFQLEFVEDLFSDVQELWLVVPEGNGKTTLLAGVAMYHGDYTDHAAVAMAASSRDQCGILLNQARGFIERSPGFEKRFRHWRGKRSVDCLRTGGTIQVFAADARTGDGIIPSLALLDELHRHPNLELHDTWHGKLNKRPGAKLAAISTAGVPGSAFEIIRERARTAAPDITVDDRHIRAASPVFILHDFGLKADDDIEDLALVARANPFSGITEAMLKAKRASASWSSAHWSRMVCNRATRTEAAAVGEAEWLAAEVPNDLERGLPCEIGLDLGWKWDATALVPLFKRSDSWLFGRTRVITPPRDGNSLRPEAIMDAFRELHDENPIQRVVMDPSAGGEQIASWLEQEIGAQVVAHSQKSAPMALAYKRFMETLRDGTQKHISDPNLTRHVLNAVAYELPDSTFKFTRPVSSRTSADEAPRREIDALIAASMVLSTAVAGSYDGPLLEML